LTYNRWTGKLNFTKSSFLSLSGATNSLQFSAKCVYFGSDSWVSAYFYPDNYMLKAFSISFAETTLATISKRQQRNGFAWRERSVYEAVGKAQLRCLVWNPRLKKENLMKRRFGSKLILCFIAAGLFSGCATTMSLQYAKPDAAAQSRGSLTVVVEDQRSAEETGGDPTRVGTIRNTFGMPFPLRCNPDRKPPLVINELVSDCLGAAGYQVVGKKAGVPQLHVALKSFWSDGYQHSRMWLVMSTALMKDKKSQPLWQSDFESNVGVTWTVGYGKFDQGFTDLLEDTKKQLISKFNSRKFRKSCAMLK
jgi:hypothetical protein